MYNFHLEIKFLDNEYWWGGAVDEGIFMPYINNYPLADLNDNNFGNQATSFFISSKVLLEKSYIFKKGVCYGNRII